MHYDKVMCIKYSSSSCSLSVGLVHDHSERAVTALEGGYAEWLLNYPMMTTNANVTPPASKLIPLPAAPACEYSKLYTVSKYSQIWTSESFKPGRSLNWDLFHEAFLTLWLPTTRYLVASSKRQDCQRRDISSRFSCRKTANAEISCQLYVKMALDSIGRAKQEIVNVWQFM